MATKNTYYQLHLKGFVGGYGYVLRATSMSRVKKRSNLFGHSAFTLTFNRSLGYAAWLVQEPLTVKTVRIPCNWSCPVP